MIRLSLVLNRVLIIKTHTLKRYNLHIKESQLEKLTKIAEAKEEAVSRIIRDAIDDYLRDNIFE